MRLAAAGPGAWATPAPLGAGLDFTHPLADGLTHAVVFTNGGGQQVTNLAQPQQVATWSNSPPYVSTAGGMGIQGNASSRVVELPGHKLSAYTHLVWFVPATLGVAQGICGMQEFNSLGAWDRDIGLDVSNHPYFYYYDGTYETLTGNATAVVGQPLCIAGVTTGALMSLYVNGRLDNTLVPSFTTGGYNGYTTPMLRLLTGGDNVSITWTDGTILTFWAWNRALGADEVAQFYAQPWVMLGPRPRLWAGLSPAVASGLGVFHTRPAYYRPQGLY